MSACLKFVITARTMFSALNSFSCRGYATMQGVVQSCEQHELNELLSRYVGVWCILATARKRCNVREVSF